MYNLQIYSESRAYVHKSAKSANLGYGKCFTSYFQKVDCHNCAFTILFFLSKYFYTSLPQTAFNYKAFFYRAEIEEGLYLLEKKKVLFIWGFRIPPNQDQYLGKA